jgi:O-antigen/teichoic acid export membrane protein
MFKLIKKTAKNSLIYGLGNLSTKIIGLILLPFYTSYLSTSEYGILSLVEITAWLLTAIVSIKLNAALFRWYYDKNYIDKRKSIFFSGLIFFLLTGLIFLLPLILFKNEISILLFETNKYSYLIILMLISTALQVVIQFILHLMQLQEKAIFYSVTSITKLLVSLVLTIVFITYYGRSVFGIYEALIIAQLLFLVITLKYILSNIEFKIEYKIINDMLKYSYPLMFAEISGIILTVSDRYVLNFMTTTSEVGLYSLAYRLSNTIRVLIYSSVMMAVTPLIYQYIDKPNNGRFYSKIMTYLSFGVMIFVLFFSLFSKEIIELVARSKDYWPASILVPVISLAIFTGILKDISLNGLSIAKKTGIIAIVVFIISTINIVLNILLIPNWGTMGAAIATLIARIISLIIFYNIAQKHYPIPYELNKVSKVVLVGIGIIITSSFISNLNIYFTVLVKLILIVSFPIILYFFNFFEDVELERINELWNTWKNPSSWKENFKQIKF